MTHSNFTKTATQIVCETNCDVCFEDIWCQQNLIRLLHYLPQDFLSMDQPRLNFGIVGCGRIAQRHAQHIAAAGRLVATCDILRPRAQQLSDPYSAHAYQCLNELLQSEPQLDVISVCSPNGLHATHAIQALSAGKHVICEKPMALTAADCGDMIQAAERANRRQHDRRS